MHRGLHSWQLSPNHIPQPGHRPSPANPPPQLRGAECSRIFEVDGAGLTSKVVFTTNGTEDVVRYYLFVGGKALCLTHDQWLHAQGGGRRSKAPSPQGPKLKRCWKAARVQEGGISTVSKAQVRKGSQEQAQRPGPSAPQDIQAHRTSQN